MSMKLVRVTDQEELAENIPLESILFVSYLNKILAADRTAVTQLIDHAVPVDIEGIEAAFPNLVVRETLTTNGENKVAREQDRHFAAHLSGLGLISGFVNTNKYRVYAEFPNDEPPYGDITHFGWFRVED